ncbi:hypothetical protein [Microbacterium arborescens]|uniref:hypothetical protein n=1 Tax=Microbacterium arborescens TaxID=33883 RepID=UPI0025A1B214|nr:hypothetical protein [Microbacterium arborescens]WJM17152.1 hypothetical protein QUC20_07590 [Microbacterium arborescens]
MSDSDPSESHPLLSRFAAGWPAVLDVEAGWFPLLAALDEELSSIAPNYVIHQVKSKFGSLRFYAQASADGSVYLPAFDEAILAAEWKSIETCELCGSPAKQYVVDLWVSTLCDEHSPKE